MPPAAETPVRALYEAIVHWNPAAIDELLDPEFEGELADGMPLGMGGRKSGRDTMRDEGWLAIGRSFKARPEPLEWISCADGRLLVLGRYTGTGRASGRPLEAAFAHLWTVRDGRVVALRHFTDTARWTEALREQGAAG